MLKWAKHQLLEEAENWVLWLPVFFAAGIIIYFQVPTEPTIGAAIRCISGPTILLVILHRRHLLWRLAGISLLFTGLGFAAAKLEAELANTHFVDSSNKPITLSGTVEDIDYKEGFPKITLTKLRIDDLPQVPMKIKLTIRTRIKGNLKVGARVITDAVLMRPPPAVIRGGYDYAKIAYFKKIGATGYSLKTLVVLEEAKDQNIRYTIADEILQVLSGDEGAISVALINGDMGQISDGVKNEFRISGLAHILSISGLHLVLVCGFFFFAARGLFSLSYKMSETLPIKKYAAIVALAGGLAYLLISGMQVPAVRAFIMVMLIMLAIIFDRTVTPMRSVCFAALVVMAFTPSTVIGPSFQMSFAAAAALIAFYEFTSSSYPALYKNKVLAWLGGSVLTSLIAGFATAAFAAYHFGRFTNYSLVANFLAAPITSFVIMPAAVLAVVLMPIGLHALPLKVMGLGVDTLIKISEHIAYLPNAYFLIPQITAFGFALIILGFLWLVLWKKRWRLFGLPLIAIGFLSAFTAPRPDILVNETGKLYALNTNGVLRFSDVRESFTAKTWGQQFGQEDILPITTHNIKGCKFDGKNLVLSCHPRFKRGSGCPLKAGMTECKIPKNSMVYLPNRIVPITSSTQRIWNKN